MLRGEKKFFVFQIAEEEENQSTRPRRVHMRKSLRWHHYLRSARNSLR